jgi:hypothetical protein
MEKQERERPEHQQSAGSDSVTQGSEPASAEAEPELTRELIEKFLARIGEAGELCSRVERQLSHTPAPGARTLIKLHRLLILKALVQPDENPKLAKLARDLIKPVLDQVAIEERAKTRRVAEKKYRDLVAAQKASLEKLVAEAKCAGGLPAEVVEMIERELKLL